MSNSVVELLAIDPPTSYHHGFVYIRQLALHVRTAKTKGKKDSQQVRLVILVKQETSTLCTKVVVLKRSLNMSMCSLIIS